MKKLLIFIVTAALLFSQSIPAIAASPDSEALEKAIKKVKTVIDIPEDASVFEYHSWDDPVSGRIWNLNWSDKNYEKYYYVMINDDGLILNFNSYESREYGIIGNMTREQAQGKAEEFLKKILPSEMKDFKLKDSSSYDSAFYFSYICYINGFPVKDVIFSLEVEKHAGKIISYHGSNYIGKKDKYPLPDEKIAKEKAESLYTDSAVSLIYNAYYDYQERELEIYPSFVTDDHIFVDAATGELLEGFIWFSPSFGYAEDASGMGSEKEEGYMLTPEEQNLVDVAAGLISKDRAVKYALSMLSWYPASSTPESASLTTSYAEKEKYIWYLHFKDFTASVNAKTGELISYYSYTVTDGKPGKVSEAAAEKTALDFIKKAAGDKAGKFKANDDKYRYRSPYHFTFSRDVDGTAFPGNYISLSIDQVSGKIAHYEIQWFDDVVFPDLAGAMAPEKAFEVFAGGDAFGLLYTRTAEDMITLVYGFVDGIGYSVDPFTGEKLGYDGKTYKDYKAVTSYEDISGKWYEQVVLALLDNGYYLAGTEFKGGSIITQEEFLRYMYSPVQLYYGQDEFYSMLINGKIITKEEKSPESAVTRQDAAKFAIRFLGLDKAAKDGDIFKNVFNDQITGGYLGYAAIAKSLGIMRGDPKGNFNGTRDLTRAEAAAIIFNLLKVN